MKVEIMLLCRCVNASYKNDIISERAKDSVLFLVSLELDCHNYDSLKPF